MHTAKRSAQAQRDQGKKVSVRNRAHTREEMHAATAAAQMCACADRGVRFASSLRLVHSFAFIVHRSRCRSSFALAFRRRRRLRRRFLPRRRGCCGACACGEETCTATLSLLGWRFHLVFVDFTAGATGCVVLHGMTAAGVFLVVVSSGALASFLRGAGCGGRRATVGCLAIVLCVGFDELALASTVGCGRRGGCRRSSLR